LGPDRERGSRPPGDIRERKAWRNRKRSEKVGKTTPKPEGEAPYKGGDQHGTIGRLRRGRGAYKAKEPITGKKALSAQRTKLF